MSTPPEKREVSGFIVVKMANLGSGHIICFEKENVVPGENIPQPSTMTFK